METKASRDPLAADVRHVGETPTPAARSKSPIKGSPIAKALAPAPPLTHAERSIVSLLLLGNTNKEIARQLGKSDQTIKRQLAMLMKQLRVRNRTELAQCISDRGLLSLSQKPR
ncbi:response regulator transcription factor [Variovorax paradoxus]|nr:response regulator transcription factor [Variovorax paradoxus]